VEKLTFLLSHAQIYAELYLTANAADHPAFSQLEITVVSLYAKILSFLALGLCLYEYEKPGFKRRAHAIFKPSEFESRLSTLEEHHQRLEQAVSGCSCVEQRRIREQLGGQYEKLQQLLKGSKLQGALVSQSQAEISKALEWICGIAHKTDHYTAANGRTEGTCEWLLKDHRYLDWLTSTTSTLLWLHGIREYPQCSLSSNGWRTKMADTIIIY